MVLAFLLSTQCQLDFQLCVPAIVLGRVCMYFLGDREVILYLYQNTENANFVPRLN
jgi:hypothetical protein